MALTTETLIDLIEVLENGTLQVRRAERVLNNGSVIATSNHRHCLAPGDDLANEDARVAAVAQVVWTPEVVAAYQGEQQPEG